MVEEASPLVAAEGQSPERAANATYRHFKPLEAALLGKHQLH
jgi:hypothetical protein